MTVAVLVPWADRCHYRWRAWEWVRHRYEQRHPDWHIITGTTEVEGFSRTQAILDARSQTDADILVVADADVWVDDLDTAVTHARLSGWAVPHLLIHRLSEQSTERVLNGTDWRGLPLSQDNTQDRKPYRGNEAGTLLVLDSAAFDTAPPDPRFIGWGSEDVAWACALNRLIGKPWRGREDLVHLWHPAEPRKSRVIGNDANRNLLARYRMARDRDRMAALIEEGRRDHRNGHHTVPGEAGRTVH